MPATLEDAVSGGDRPGLGLAFLAVTEEVSVIQAVATTALERGRVRPVSLRFEPGGIISMKWRYPGRLAQLAERFLHTTLCQMRLKQRPVDSVSLQP